MTPSFTADFNLLTLYWHSTSGHYFVRIHLRWWSVTKMCDSLDLLHWRYGWPLEHFLFSGDMIHIFDSFNCENWPGSRSCIRWILLHCLYLNCNYATLIVPSIILKCSRRQLEQRTKCSFQACMAVHDDQDVSMYAYRRLRGQSAGLRCPILRSSPCIGRIQTPTIYKCGPKIRQPQYFQRLRYIMAYTLL